ncbi:hypothetical protein D3C80_1406850 [compost metagenome]
MLCASTHCHAQDSHLLQVGDLPSPLLTSAGRLGKGPDPCHILVRPPGSAQRECDFVPVCEPGAPTWCNPSSNITQDIEYYVIYFLACFML